MALCFVVAEVQKDDKLWVNAMNSIGMAAEEDNVDIAMIDCMVSVAWCHAEQWR